MSKEVKLLLLQLAILLFAVYVEAKSAGKKRKKGKKK